MYNEYPPLTEWIICLDRGDYTDSDIDTQISAGWEDWACPDGDLKAKTKELGVRVKEIAKSPLFNPDTSYVCFKNNKTVEGNSYDMFFICELSTANILYSVAPKITYGKSAGLSMVWDSETRITHYVPWNEVVEFFNPVDK